MERDVPKLRGVLSASKSLKTVDRAQPLSRRGLWDDARQPGRGDPLQARGCGEDRSPQSTGVGGEYYRQTSEFGDRSSSRSGEAAAESRSRVDLARRKGHPLPQLPKAR